MFRVLRKVYPKSSTYAGAKKRISSYRGDFCMTVKDAVAKRFEELCAEREMPPMNWPIARVLRHPWCTVCWTRPAEGSLLQRSKSCAMVWKSRWDNFSPAKFSMNWIRKYGKKKNLNEKKPRPTRTAFDRGFVHLMVQTAAHSM